MSQDPSDDSIEQWTGTDKGRSKTRVGPAVVNAVRDNVEVAMFSPEKLKEVVGDVASLDNRTVIQRLKHVRSRGLVEPDGRFTEHNVIVKPYRELLAELINPEVATPNREATHIAFGDDTTATDPSDTHLVNEVYRQQIDDHVTRLDDDQYAATVLIQSNDAVGESLLEAGLVNTSDSGNADDEAFNRVLLSDPNNRLDPKSSDFAVTVTIELTFLDESQVA
jgi:hypothetical protein